MCSYLFHMIFLLAPNINFHITSSLTHAQNMHVGCQVIGWYQDVSNHRTFQPSFFQTIRPTFIPGISLQYFIKWTHRQRSNTSNSRTHGHNTQVINIHEKIRGHEFPWHFLAIFYKLET